MSTAKLARFQGDFARPLPENYEAKRAFSGVVAVMKATPNPERFWECLTHFKDEQEFLASELETSDDEEEADKELQQIWTGHFRFNLSPEHLPPEWSKYGWVMGKEREDIKAANVAIKLTSYPKERGVRGRHARRALNQDSNALMLHVDDNKIIRLNGEPIKGQSRVIDGQQTRLQSGHCNTA